MIVIELTDYGLGLLHSCRAVSAFMKRYWYIQANEPVIFIGVTEKAWESRRHGRLGFTWAGFFQCSGKVSLNGNGRLIVTASCWEQGAFLGLDIFFDLHDFGWSCKSMFNQEITKNFEAKNIVDIGCNLLSIEHKDFGKNITIGSGKFFFLGRI